MEFSALLKTVSDPISESLHDDTNATAVICHSLEWCFKRT